MNDSQMETMKNELLSALDRKVETMKQELSIPTVVGDTTYTAGQDAVQTFHLMRVKKFGDNVKQEEADVPSVAFSEDGKMVTTMERVVPDRIQVDEFDAYQVIVGNSLLGIFDKSGNKLSLDTDKEFVYETPITEYNVAKPDWA